MQKKHHFKTYWVEDFEMVPLIIFVNYKIQFR